MFLHSLFFIMLKKFLNTNFVYKNWLLIISVLGFIVSTLYVKHLPILTPREIKVLFILFLLFVIIRGITNTGIINFWVNKFSRGKYIPLKLVLITFILSMIVTNDIAIIIIVPFSLALNLNKKGTIIILETLAANAGSALTPIGNPQNLYIYLYFHLNLLQFVSTIAPFSLLLLIVLILFSIQIKSEIRYLEKKEEIIRNFINKRTYFFIGSFLIILAVIFKLLPWYVLILILILSFFTDQNSLKVDYALLLTFFFFFGIAENLRSLITTEFSTSHNIFLVSALISQITSNVPTTLIFAKLTKNWEHLLWGVNAGGFGSLIASFANLIAYKFYVESISKSDVASFTLKFTVYSYLFLFVSFAIYFILQ